MSRTVFCRKYQEELEGLERAPYPGPIGQDVFDNISKKAWQEWTDHQTMLINEKHLNMMDAESRWHMPINVCMIKCILLYPQDISFKF